MRIFKDAVHIIHGITKTLKKFVYKRYIFNRIFNVVNNIMQTNTKVLLRLIYRSTEKCAVGKLKCLSVLAVDVNTNFL